MGGAAASQAVIKAAAKIWEQSHGIFTSPQEDLTAIAKQAHDTIRQLAPNERRSPASTIVALYIDQDHAHWIHSGDSRLYWFRHGAELKRTRDHSVVQLLLEQGKITADELNSHPDKGRILKTLGASTFKGVDYDACTYEPGDTFVLCSDGYWESLAPGENPLPSKPQDITTESHIQQLVHQAVEKNGTDSDNTTLAIVSTHPTEQPKQTKQTKQNPSQLKAVLLTLFYVIIAFDILFVIYLLFIK